MLVLRTDNLEVCMQVKKKIELEGHGFKAKSFGTKVMETVKDQAMSRQKPLLGEVFPTGIYSHLRIRMMMKGW